uniref:Pericentrin n=1 Tax=Eptatretus burgeri TaxID=7764 RepID=A0A8C4WRL5_EPTBU
MATQVVAEESLGEYCANEPNFSEPHDKVPENEDASPKEPVETSTLNCVQTDNCMAFNGDITNNFIVQDNLKMNSEKEELKKSPICSISDEGLVLQPHLEHFNVENFSEEMCFIEDTSVDKLHRSLTDGLYGEDLCTGISHVSNELGQRWHTMEDRYKADVMEKAFRLNMVKDYTCLSHQNPIADFQLQLNATQQIDGWVQFGCKRDAIKRHSASAIADKSDIMRGTFLKDDSDASNTDNLFQNGWVNGQFLQHHGGESDFENFQNLSGRRLKRICDDVKDRNVDILLHNINLAIREIVLNMQKQIDNLKENYEQVVHDKMCLAKIITYQQDECSKVEDENLENGADILASNDEEFDSVKICINDSCVLKEQCAKLWQIHSELQLENNKLKSLECSLKEQMPEQYQKFAQCEKNFQMNFVEIQNELKQVLREKLELEKKASSQAEEVTLLRNQLLEIRQKYGDSKLDKECGITIGTTQNCATELENSFGECLKEESKCDVSGNFSLSNFEEMYLEGVQNESYLNRFSNRVLQMHFFKDRLGNLQEDKDLFVLQLEEQEHLMTRMQGQSEVTGLMESQAQLSFEFQVTAPQLPRANLHAPEENFKAKQSSIIAVLEQRTAMGKPFQNDLDTVKERRAELMSQKQQNQEMHDALSCETQNFEKGDANKELGYQLEKENKRMEQTEENLRVNGDALHTGLAKKAIQPEVHRSHAEEQVLKIELLENQLTVEHLKVQELQCLLDERHSLLQKQSQERSHTVSGLTEHECCIEEKHEEEMQALKAKYELQLAEAKEELEKRLMELREQLDSQRITQIALIKEVHEREREREVAAIIEQHIMEMQQLRVTLFGNQRRLERGINCGCDERQEVEAMAREQEAELEDKKQNLEREHQLKRETLLQEIREQQMQQDGALQELQLLYKQQMQQLFQEQEAQHQAKIEALSSQHKHEVQVMALASERELEKLAQELKIRLGVTESWPAKERVEDDRHSSLQTEYGEVQRVTQHSHKEVLLEELSRLQVLQKEEKENLNKAVQAKANQAEQFQAEASRLRELVQQVQLELETVLHRRERENGEGDTLFTMLRADLQNKEIDRQEILGANQHILQVLSEVFQQTLSSEELIGQRVVSLLADGRPVHTVMAEHLGQTASEVTSAIAGSEVLDNFDTPHEKLEISQHLAESLFVGPVLEPREEKLVLESTQRLHGALQHLLSLLIELTQQVQEARSAHAELLQESTRCTMELSKAMCEHKQLLVKLEEENQAHQRLKFELYETKGLLEGFRLEKSLKSWVPWWEPLAQLVENTDEGYLHPEVPQVQNCTAGISEQQESDLQASVCVVEKLESGPAQNAAEEKKRGPKARAEKDVYERSSQVTTLEASLEGQQKRSGKLAEENETASGGLQKQVHFLESQSKKSKNLHQCAKFRIDEQETERANLQQVVCRLEGPPQCAKGLTSLLNAVSETQLTELEEQLKNGAERWRELVQGKLLAEEALHALQGEFSQFQQEYTKSRQVQQQLQQDLDRQHRAIEDLQQDKESLQEQQCENLLQITGLQARLDKQKQQLLPQGQNQGEQDDQLDQLLRQTRAEIELQSRQLESLRNELQQKEIEKLSLAEEGDAMNMRLKEMKEENLKLQDEIDSLRTQSSQTSSNVSSDILGLPIALLEEKNQEIDLLNEQISVLQEEMKIIRKRGLSDDKTTPSMEWMKSGTSATSLPGLQQSVSTMTLSVNLPHSVPNAVPSVEWPRSVTSAAPSVERLRSVTSAAPSVERLRTMTSVAHSVERPWSVDSAVLSVEQPQSMTSAAPSVERPRSVTSAAPSVEQLRTVTSVVPSVERPRSVTSATPSVERPRSVTSEVLSVGRPRSVTHAALSVGRPRSVASTIPSVERMRSVASSTSSLVDHSYSPVPLSEKSNSCASDISRCLHMGNGDSRAVGCQAG